MKGWEIRENYIVVRRIIFEQQKVYKHLNYGRWAIEVDFRKTIISFSTIHSGAGIHVAVFDTGIQDGHPHFPNIAEVTNWTDEKNDHDSMKEIGLLIVSILMFFSDWSWFICCWCYWE